MQVADAEAVAQIGREREVPCSGTDPVSAQDDVTVDELSRLELELALGVALSVGTDVEDTAAGEGDDHLLEAVVFAPKPNLDFAYAGSLLVELEKSAPIAADAVASGLILWDDLLVPYRDVAVSERDWG